MTPFEAEQAPRLLLLLQQLLEIEPTEREAVLLSAAQLVAQALAAEKADVFLLEAESQTLIAQGISDTPLGHLQRAVGLHRLPLANGGRTAEVFQTGNIHRSGQVQQDAEELTGIRQTLKIQSMIAVPLIIGGERRGVIQVNSTQPDAFTQQDQVFLQAVAHWVGSLAHRAELIQQVKQSAVDEARRLTAEELMTILAHDLRNDLTPIKGRLDLLKLRAIRSQQGQFVEDVTAILSGLQRFERLITDVMDLTRLSHGLFTLTCKLVYLHPIVQEAVAATHTPSVAIEVQVPQDLFVWADAGRLQQALENVLSNAVKHSPPGTSVRVRAEMQEQDALVVLSVKDQGSGIAPAVLPHIFEPFRAEKGSTGLGLGLYLAHQIVLAHGGTLRVETGPRRGTCFFFSLPVDAPKER